MTDRDRLIELIIQADNECANTTNCKKCRAFGTGSDCVNHNIADYLLENGVIVPPCKVGDTFWEQFNWRDTADELKVSSLTQKADGSWKIRLTNLRIKSVFEITPDKIGKTVFLTREEAEKALAERGGEG